MIIEVVNITGPVHVAKGNGYNTLEVAYKQDGKIAGKKLVDFNYPEVFAIFEGAQAGEFYKVTSEKNSNGYWDWIDAEKTTAPAEETVAKAPKGRNTTGGKPGTGRVVGSTYETHEERALNRAAIIRQFSVGAAKDMLIAGGKVPTHAALFDSAALIEEWVYAEMPKRMAQILQIAEAK